MTLADRLRDSRAITNDGTEWSLDEAADLIESLEELLREVYGDLSAISFTKIEKALGITPYKRSEGHE